MPKLLTPEQATCYREQGYATPIRVMSEADAAAYRARLESFERGQGRPLDGRQRSRTYLLYRWAYELLTHPKVLDAVEDAIGPDILIFHWTTWIKEAHSPAYVTWHQDATYFGLEPGDQVTAWLALSPASEEAGCMRVLPGSHKFGQLPVEHKPDADNLLSSGQKAVITFDERQTVPMPLRPGEISLHHTFTVHGSAGNTTDDRRIGLGMNFIPAHVNAMKHVTDAGAFCSAMLVRGTDRYRHFVPETPPEIDEDAEAMAMHADAIARYRAMVRALGHMTAARHDATQSQGTPA
jgi:ectoine hydroxylase-related dioxygenase (phytanoyl-CoA dioxygenase family)